MFIGPGVAALVDVNGVEHGRGVVQGGQGAHQGSQDAADNHTLQTHGQKRIHQHREGEVRVLQGAGGGVRKQGGGQLGADQGIRFLGEGKGNHARNQEEEHRKHLQIGSEDSAPAGFLLVFTGQDTLYDELVCAPVPEADDGAAEEGAVPREGLVLSASHEGGHVVSQVVHGLGTADVHHGIPAAQFLQAQVQDDQGAYQQDGRLQHGGLEHGFHTADNGVDGCDDHQRQGGYPEVDAQQGVQGQAAGQDRYGNLGEHIAGQGNIGEDAAALAVVAFFQELGHGIDHTALVEGDEYPAQDEDHPALDFPVGLGHTGGGARTGQADEVLRPDVGGKDGCADGNPGGAAAAEEIITGSFFLFPGDIPDNPDHGHEEDGNHHPVPGCERDAVKVHSV